MVFLDNDEESLEVTIDVDEYKASNSDLMFPDMEGGLIKYSSKGNEDSAGRLVFQSISKLLNDMRTVELDNRS